MFEGKRPLAGDCAQPARPEDALRPLEWTELASRLAAARDLRASLAPGEIEGEGSFDAHSARWIAAHRDGQEFVNLEDSANGKGADRSGDTSDGAPAATPGGA